MIEELLVLAKAIPTVSKKYEHLICVAGITREGRWRRIYPIPWEVFINKHEHYFKKKQWIKYKLRENKSSDGRPESRKIYHNTIEPLKIENFKKN
jgi:hypothetical protein